MRRLEKSFKNNRLKQSLTALLMAAIFVMQTLGFTPSAFADTAVPNETSTPLTTTDIADEQGIEERDESGVEKRVDVTPSTPPAANALPSQDPDAKEDIEEAEVVKIANVILNTTIEHSVSVKLDGKDLQSGLVHRSDKNGLYFDPIPLFEALDDTFVYNADESLFTFKRSQDNANLAINMKSGVVLANGKPVGKLPHFGEISENRILLTANALAFLTGTSASYDKETRTFEFKLDPRLKIATGFDIFVEDVPLQDLNPEPRSVGSVLILPILPIADALGHDVAVLDGGTILRVRRSQDSAVFMLNLDTGLVSLRDRPFGLVQDVALIDRTNLLLPTNAIETLTGTHVNVITGTNRIEIFLDDALRGGAVPEGRVDDILKDTPFTPEAVSFTLSPDRVNQVNFAFHKGRYNGRVRYEIQDLPSNIAELEPSWLSLNFRHTGGIYGSLGDYSSDLRELDGVGIRRIRGASFVKETEKGNRWALAAGIPEDGRRQISSDQTRSNFSGLAAGARFASKNGWEAGLAVHHDSLNNDQRAVLSAISGSLGRNNTKKYKWSGSADIGVFNGPQRERAIDASGFISGRYEFNKAISIDAGADYQGVEFQRNILQEREDDEELAALEAEISGVENIDVVENPVEDNQIEGQDIFGQRVGVNFTPTLDSKIISDPSLSVRLSRTQNGFTAGKDTGSTVTTGTVSAGTTIKPLGLSLGGGIINNNVNFNDDRENVNIRQYRFQATKSYDWIALRAQYLRNESSDGASDDEQLVVTANFNADRNYNVPLPKEGHLSITPSISVGQSNGNNRVRGGVVANLSTGHLFGKKNEVSASFGVLQSINNFGSGNTSEFLTVSAARQINFGKNLSLGVAYRNNLSGDQRIGLELRGGYRFNEPRRFTDTKPGRGVLKGQAFLDKNYDGIRQPDEPGAGGVILRVQRSGLSLRTDGQGFFTIQNIKEGLHTLAVDSRSLPLGFGLPDDRDYKATIRDGHISTLEIPIIQRGQLRGFTFIDANEDGEYNKGEERIEGVRLKLLLDGETVDGSAVSTSFGQFAFDDLRPQTYEIHVSPKGGPGYEGGTQISVDVDPSSFELNKVAVPLKPARREILTAEADVGVSDTPKISNDEARDKAPETEVPNPPPQTITTSATP